jgi:hypothetical protein
MLEKSDNRSAARDFERRRGGREHLNEAREVTEVGRAYGGETGPISPAATRRQSVVGESAASVAGTASTMLGSAAQERRGFIL